MAVCMNFSLNMSITLRAIANMLDTTNMMLMHWMPDFHALCEKELLEKMERRMGRMDEYVIPADVLEAFSNNEVFVKKTSKVENSLELISTLYHLFKLKSRSYIDTEVFVKKFTRLLDDNMHLPIVSNLNKLELHSIKSEVILLQLCRFHVMNSMTNVPLGQIVDLFEEGKDRNMIVYGLLQGNHELFQRKLITFGCADGIKDKEVLCLTVKARRLLIPEYKLRGMTTQSAEITSHKDIVFKNLYYNPSVEQQIQRLHSLLEEKNFRMVQKRLQERGLPQGHRLSLLWLTRHRKNRNRASACQVLRQGCDAGKHVSDQEQVGGREPEEHQGSLCQLQGASQSKQTLSHPVVQRGRCHHRQSDGSHYLLR